MLTLNSRQLREKLAAWLKSHMAVLLVGPPGTGKTYTARRVAIDTFGEGLVEVLDGGNESAWKGLFPYKTPSGKLELGMALRASGYVIDEQGQMVKAQPGGALIVDECNRVPPELKSPFQLMASERIVPWPEGGTVKLDIAIVSTANDSDLGVEEASRAELDRYDLVVRLAPTPEEQAKIISSETGVRLEVAQLIYEAVAELSGKLDPKKVHLPEGLRMAISIAKVILTGTLGPVDAFRGAAERCWPLGRRGAGKYRPEFDQAVLEVAGRFASKLANAGELVQQQQRQPQTVSAPSEQVDTLAKLLASLGQSTLAQISTSGFVPLPRPFPLMVPIFTAAFGLGAVKRIFSAYSPKGAPCETVITLDTIVVWRKDGHPDAIKFRNADRHRVEKFCRLCEKL